MKKKKLYLLSPSDRFNYGDMLFTYILQYYLKSSVDEIINCSTSESDLSDKGGIPTQDINKIFEDDSINDKYLIIAGGECLFTTWPVILSFTSEDVMKKVNRINHLPRIPFLYRTYITYLNFFVKRKFLIPCKYPFTIGLNELPNYKAIIYNSVGSVNLAYRKDVLNKRSCKEILESSSYISVRDRGTLVGIKKMGISSNLVPDSAILMSNIFNDDFLLKKISINNLCLHNKYIFFQINELSLLGNENYISNILTRIYQKYSLHYVLCPIGTALGHSDDIALAAISNLLPSQCYNIIFNPNIWDIMYLIKNSCLYIGTSLHGAITAMSFSVPFVTHGKIKLKQYMKDWGGCFCELGELEQNIIKQIESPQIIDVNSQKALALESIYKIKNIIEK